MPANRIDDTDILQGDVFLTGATGFLGAQIIEEIITRSTVTVYALVRADSPEHAAKRLHTLWWERPVIKKQIGTRIIPLPGDITKKGLGLPENATAELGTTIAYVIHATAEVAITASREQLWRINVEGTARVLDFAAQLNTKHPLRRFAHASTTYVAGSRKGRILESIVENDSFGSLYEQSKYEAEVLVEHCRSTFPIAILRPGQIVGDSRTGAISTFNTVYYPLKLYLKGKLGFLPIDKMQKVNMIPVDTVARLIVDIIADTDNDKQVFHLTTPYHEQPTVGELLEEVRYWAAENLDTKLRGPVLLSLPFLNAVGRNYNLKPDDKSTKKTKATNLLALMPYFSEQRIFDTTNTEAYRHDPPASWKKYLHPLLSYATTKGFLNQSERTVFEQMEFRLGKKSNVITYHDVGLGGATTVSADHVKATASQAAESLRALGIRPGDHIALTGTNGTNYLILDMAIGLIGAIGVPLYYTSPIEEIDLLLEKSRSKMLFVGSKRVFDSIDRLVADIPLVSLSIGNPNTKRTILGWDDFLKLGTAVNATALEPGAPSYDDIATIRYTSGTTGQPKGVMFDHGQLKWMGETLPSLLSWKTRTQPIRYLSFLPMSHVVEGILVAYAPYYILSDVDIFYLNEFDRLTEALPQVRPTIFFSVPRFYEKLWAQFTSSGFGKYYLSLEKGPVKNVLRRLCRFFLLRKAGLDACNQLIVGSAPVSMELLESFRDLGIEIHNAYGLTEAPLITLSRLGKNELGSVGELLPKTQAKFADDGEILIKGPQVTAGYDGDPFPATDADGFFKTGDFGHISAKGHLIIEGRKKELLIASYGKNINPQKIEILLKSIPAISEALVFGDGLPYCSAMLWLDIESDLPADDIAIAQAVERINKGLSHPEQIKKWAIITQTLSIADGELTPNLKLRRTTIQEKHRDIVEALYSDTPPNLPGVTFQAAVR